MNLSNIDKADIYMEMVQVLARASECEPHRGTIFVKDRRMLASSASEGTGENSTSHSIQVAIHKAASFGAKLEGSTCFTTHKPCKYCQMALDRVGVEAIVYA